MDAFQEETMLRITVLICLLFGVMAPAQVLADTDKVFIDTPSLCNKLDHVDGNKVFLKSGDEKCFPSPGKIEVRIGDKEKPVMVFVDDTFWKEQSAKDFGIAGIGDVLEAGKKIGDKLSVSDNAYSGKGAEEAQRVYEYYKSPAFQEKLNAESERLQKTVFKDAVNDYYKDIKQGDGNSKSSLFGSKERLYIFISESMPMQTIRNYAQTLDKIKSSRAALIMRGFIGGMTYVKPTMHFISNIIKENPDCDMRQQQCDAYSLDVLVDPLLFRRYGITTVPAMVYVPDISVADEGQSEGIEGNAQVTDFHKMEGDVSLEYFLEEILKDGPNKSVDSLLAALRKKLD